MEGGISAVVRCAEGRTAVRQLHRGAAVAPQMHVKRGLSHRCCLLVQQLARLYSRFQVLLVHSVAMLRCITKTRKQAV